MAMRWVHVVAGCWVAALIAGCTFGLSTPEAGREASLEADIALVDGRLRQIAEEALGPYTVLGKRVYVINCYHPTEDQYMASIFLTIRPELPAAAARQAALDWAARIGATVTSNGLYTHVDALLITGDPVLDGVRLQFKTQGVNLASSTGCYGRERIDSDDPYDLRVETGTAWIYVP
jgi:hypothetical protein